jgi:hypothetical protein
MHLYAFKKSEIEYKAHYRIYRGKVTNLRITELHNSDNEIEPSLLFSEIEKRKFLRVLQLHSLKYLGC